MNSKQAKHRNNADNNNRNRVRHQQNTPKHQKKEKFYNVYQFVPFDSAPSKQTHSVEQIKSGNTHIRHDGWFSHTVDSNGEQTELYSGRIVCKIKTLSPTFVGNGEITEKHPKHAADNSSQASTDEAKTVAHYTTANGELAFPASSLRGMISNIAEAISNSPMRVLGDGDHTVRATRKDALSAIGVLRLTATGEWKLLPLCLPTMYKGNKKNRKTKAWENLFKGRKWHECTRQYIGNYKRNTLENLEVDDSKDLSSLETFRFKKQNQETYYYAKPIDTSIADDTFSSFEPIFSANQKSIKIKNDTFLGFNNVEEHSTNRNKVSKLSTSQSKGYPHRGVIYLREDPAGTHDDTPDSKKHELFIPFPSTAKNYQTVKQEVVDTLVSLLNKYWSADKPHPLPHGYRHLLTEDKLLQATDLNGLLMYFDIDDQGIISELSFSSIWRKSYTESLWTEERLQHLAPWHSDSKRGLHTTEALFGVVEDKPANESSESTTKSTHLASRIQFNDAIFAANSQNDYQEEHEVKLKILASPKPPSPKMYFHDEKGVAVPNGRKVYPPHHDDKQKNKWISKTNDNDKQKVRIRPLKEGKVTEFTIDFNQLSHDELSLLMLSLHPCDRFIHRLGMGKPLGLGHVDIKPKRIELRQPKHRYQADSIINKHHKFQTVWENPTLTPDRNSNASTKFSVNVDSPLINHKQLAAVQYLGIKESSDENFPRCYPYTIQQGAYSESEGFKWFAEKNNRQTLYNAEIHKQMTQGNILAITLFGIEGETLDKGTKHQLTQSPLEAVYETNKNNNRR